MQTIGTLTLIGSSPATAYDEPISVSEMAHYLSLPETLNYAEESQLAVMIAAARDQAEQCQNRDLVLKQWEMNHDYFWTEEIELRSGLVSVELVKYKDSDGNETTLVENTDYLVDTKKEPGLIMPTYGNTWPSFTPWPSSAVTIQFTSGKTSTSVFWTGGHGQKIKIGMMMLVSEWYNNRLPQSYSAAAGGTGEFDPIVRLLSSGARLRAR